MSLNNFIVDLPDKKITINRSNKNKTPYVYYTKRAYRNKKNQPTSEKILIGKLDDASGGLIPNNNYYEIYGAKKTLNTKSILDYGNFFAMQFILEDLKILDILQATFPTEYNNIITIAMYMLCEGNVMFYCDDWCSETFTNLDEAITSQKSSEIFNNIDFDSRMKFFKKWAKIRKTNECIAYDVTSISSYSKCNEDIEWGYNRDKENLPQFNLGMYFGESSKLPIFYSVYPGSIVDKSHLKFMMQHNNELGIETVKFVMDKGFYNSDNLKYMIEKNYSFILSTSNTLIANKKLIDKHKPTITSSKFYRNKYDIYSTYELVKKHSKNTKIHIYYDKTKATLEELDLYQKINNAENLLQQKGVNLTKKQLKLCKKYFDITSDKEGNFTYEKNFENIDKLRSDIGYFLLITDDIEKNSDEVLEIYRKKDVVEKSFDNLKNSIDMKRVRCHSKSTTDGKIFVSFISLIIKSQLENKLSNYLSKNNSSIEKIIRELKKIKVITVNDGRKLLNPLNKKQKELLTELGVDIELTLEKYL